MKPATDADLAAARQWLCDCLECLRDGSHYDKNTAAAQTLLSACDELAVLRERVNEAKRDALEAQAADFEHSDQLAWDNYAVARRLRRAADPAGDGGGWRW